MSGYLLDMRPRGAGGGSSGAPIDATYITQTPNATLTNEQALSLLATGLLKNTTGTGVLSIATPTIDFASAAQGALADTSLQPGDIGVTVQSWDADLDTLAALAKTKGNLIGGTGATWQALPVGADGLALVADSLEATGLKWAAIVAGVSSVFGRTGAVIAALNDYPASFITNTPAGGIASIDVQGALNELDTEKAAITSLATVAFSGAYGDLLGLPTLGTLATFNDAPSDGSTYGRNNGTWAAVGSGLPSGSNTQIQFNDSGVFGGDADLTWNKTTNALTLTGTQTISSTLAVGGSLISGTNLTVINPTTHTRLGIGASSAARHSLVSFYDSTPTKRFDVGYDPAATQLYIYDGTGNILTSTNAGVTTIGRSGGSVAFGVGALTLNGGSGNAYFSLTSTTTTGAMGHKYQQSGTDIWVVALMGSAVAATDQFSVGGAIRWYNQGLNYTGMAIEATKSMVSIGFGNPAGQLHVRQRSTTNAIAVIEMEQLDLSEEFFNFVGTVSTGNPIEAVGAKTLTVTHFVRVAVNGSFLYMPLGTIA